jgi:hypothetical protein
MITLLPKTISTEDYNDLAEDIICKLSPKSMMTLRNMEYINAGEMIQTLMKVHNVIKVDGE